MSPLQSVSSVLRQSVRIYLVLLRILVPVMILTRLAVELGLVAWLSPLFAPLMVAVGLPPELGLAWLTAALVGIWAGAVALFTVVSVEELTTAQLTVFSALALFAHSLPVEQRIVQRAGPGLVATTLLRLLAGFLFAWLLHLLFSQTGWLARPASPHLVPASQDGGWLGFALKSAESLAWLFVFLVALVAMMRVLEATGLMRWLTAALAPMLGFCGISATAAPITMIGLLLGLAYGGGLIIQEAQRGHIGPRDVFLATVLMGCAHSLIEDTLVLVAMGADAWSLSLGRIVFSVLFVALVARLIARIPERAFNRFLYNGVAVTSSVSGPVASAPGPAASVAGATAAVSGTTTSADAGTSRSS